MVDVDGGLVSVRALRIGQLLETKVVLGQEVSRGTVLARLSGETEQAEADAASADLQRARAELASARLAQDTLQERLRRVREAVELGAESALARDELQTQVDAQNSALPVAEASVAAAEARWRAARAVADSTIIRAPIDGRIVQVNARNGDMVGSNDGPALFLLRPHAALVVRASVPARDVSRIRVGSYASVAAADDGSSRSKGRVILLGEIARKPDPAMATDDFASERVVDCVIQLDSNAGIRVGSLVLVSFNQSST